MYVLHQDFQMTAARQKLVPTTKTVAFVQEATTIRVKYHVKVYPTKN
jgi:hypothetical protein